VCVLWWFVGGGRRPPTPPHPNPQTPNPQSPIPNPRNILNKKEMKQFNKKYNNKIN